MQSLAMFNRAVITPQNLSVVNLLKNKWEFIRVSFH